MTQDSIARWEWEGGTTAAEPRIPADSTLGEAPGRTRGRAVTGARIPALSRPLRAAGEDVHMADDPDGSAASRGA
jgi:hypothetical protein